MQVMNIFVVLVACCLFQFSSGNENPGIQITLGIKGLDLARQIAGEEVSKSISTLAIPHISFNHGEINNLRVTSFGLGNTRINTATPNRVTLGITGARISLDCKWKYTKHVVVKLKFKGSASVTASSVDISQSVQLARTQDGKPIIISGPCSANIGSFKFKLKGHFDVKILNFFAGFFKNNVRKMIQNKICPAIQNEINNLNKQTQSNLKVVYPVSKDVSVNVALALDPTASPNNITAAFKGRFYSSKSPSEYPFANPLIPQLNMTSQMARIVLSDYSINTFLYTLWQNEKFNWTLTQSKIDKIIGTNVTADFLAKYMPIFKKFEHSGVSLMMKISSISSPLSKFIPDGVDVSGSFGFQIFVLLNQSKNPFKVFDVPLSVDLICKVNVNNTNIKVQVENLKFSATDLGGLPSTFVSALLNAVVPGTILPVLNEAIGKAPFMLPSYFGYEFNNFNVQFDPDFIIISSDITHQ